MLARTFLMSSVVLAAPATCWAQPEDTGHSWFVAVTVPNEDCEDERVQFKCAIPGRAAPIVVTAQVPIARGADPVAKAATIADAINSAPSNRHPGGGKAVKATSSGRTLTITGQNGADPEAMRWKNASAQKRVKVVKIEPISPSPRTPTHVARLRPHGEEVTTIRLDLVGVPSGGVFQFGLSLEGGSEWFRESAPGETSPLAIVASLVSGVEELGYEATISPHGWLEVRLPSRDLVGVVFGCDDAVADVELAYPKWED